MKSELIDVRSIWSAAPHNAFTTLAHFQGRWFCAFREGVDHGSEDGAICLIVSPDGVEWSGAAQFESEFKGLPDLRDPKLSITPDGQLMLLAGATTRNPAFNRKSCLWLSRDGMSWTGPEVLTKDDVWLWGRAVDGEMTYFSGYSRKGVNLHCADRLPEVRLLGTLYQDTQFPNETAIHFNGGRAVALIRRELAEGQSSTPPFNNGTAVLATSVAPFQEWQTSDIGFYLGGPELLALPDGRLLAAGREIRDGKHLCALWEVDTAAGLLTKLVTFPSGGDCAYPGMVWHNERLWVSYYSSHEGSSRIYFAQVHLSQYDDSLVAASGEAREF